MSTTRVLLADHQEMVRTGLRLVLERESDLCVAGEAADGADAIRETLRVEPDVVVMEAGLPVIDGVERFGYPFDFSWTGPWWIGARTLDHVPVWLVPIGVALMLAAVYGALSRLWEPMGEADERNRLRKMAETG